MKSRIARDNLGWLKLKLGNIARADLTRQRRTAAALIERLYGEGHTPGVILADEVGMGKTYVSLAVAASLFHNYGQAKKVIVLTPSSQMAETWLTRWDSLIRSNHRITLPEGRIIHNMKQANEGISFGSYEEMKLVTGGEVRAAFDQAVSRPDRPRGRYRRRLLRGLFDVKEIRPPPPVDVGHLPQGRLNRIWREVYDEESKYWYHPYEAYRKFQSVLIRSRRTKRSQMDLVILDEAHRLAGTQRQTFFQEVLGGKAIRTIFVTATPFSLTVQDLIERILDLHVGAGAPTESVTGLRDLIFRYHDIVKSRVSLPGDLKSDLQTRLRRYLVRSVWPDKWPGGGSRRESSELEVPLEYFSSSEQAYAMFAMEQKFIEMLEQGGRAYISVHRETLCSSYEAIKESNEENGYFDEVIRVLPKNGLEVPKLEYAVSRIPELLATQERVPEKVVIFSNRNATIRVLAKRLESLFVGQRQGAARRWDGIRKVLKERGWKGNWKKGRLASYIFPEMTSLRIEGYVEKVEDMLKEAGVEGDHWDRIWGPGRRANWVSTITGERSGEDRSNEEVQFAFNLPGPPYILICSQKGRESIDLHRWCRKIVHYDLDWNPAVMEQRIGRIDRINSRAARRHLPVEVYYFRTRGTYEERIFNIVKERVEMTRVLLGAGDWLAQSNHPEVQFGNALKGYQLDFAPAGHAAAQVADSFT